MMLDKSEQDHDVIFMKERSYTYKWPLSYDIFWIPIQDILMKQNAPNIINNRQYRFITL